MLILNDLININFLPGEKEISLDLLIDFYENYLCKRIFIFTLSNQEVVKLYFKGTSEIFHISGIDHIYENKLMDGCKFIEGVKSGDIDLASIQKMNPHAYKDYLDRIRSIFCIDTILKNCEYLYFPEGKIGQTSIKSEYLLLRGLDGKNLHLGIDTYKKTRPYFVRTLLVTEGKNASKFIQRAESRFKVTKLEIRDKDTNELLECIERQKAENYVKEKIVSIVEEWLENDFESIVRECIKNMQEQEGILSCGIDNVEQCADLLYGQIRKDQKKEWSKILKSIIDQNKESLKKEVSRLDPYGGGKIIGEGIRQFEGGELESYMNDRIKKIIMELLDSSL